ncbi:MAG: 30S ribosomal protein S11 [Rickettsiales bacterium]
MSKAYKKKKEKRTVTVGIVTINATFNNTLVTIADLNGNVIASNSAGQQGFKGSKKSTPYAAQVAAEKAAADAQEWGLKTVTIQVKGPGSGRESGVRAIAATGLKVTVIKDVTPLAHNGCRRKKRRRV